jgi:hypothetical protein
MVAALPLDPEDVDFHRITNFFNLYRHVMETHGDPRKCEAQKTMDRATESMTVVTTNIVTGGLGTFSMRSDSHSVASWLQKPIAQKYVPFLQHLEVVVQFTGMVVDIFYATYVRPNPLSANVRETSAPS